MMPVYNPMALIAKANTCFGMRMAEAARAEAEEWLRIGNKAMLSAAEPEHPFNLAVELGCGQKRIARQVGEAFGHWQADIAGAFRPMSEQEMAGLSPWSWLH